MPKKKPGMTPEEQKGEFIREAKRRIAVDEFDPTEADAGLDSLVRKASKGIARTEALTIPLLSLALRKTGYVVAPLPGINFGHTALINPVPRRDLVLILFPGLKPGPNVSDNRIGEVEVALAIARSLRDVCHF